MRGVCVAFLSLALALMMAPQFKILAAVAAEVGGKTKPQRIILSLGREGDRKRLFHPSLISLAVGRPYTLVIENPSLEVHEFDAPDLVSAARSSDVKVLDDIGATARPLAKIVGTPAEIEVMPGGTVEWTFVPVLAGSYDILCDIEDQSGKTHTAMGMKGLITVK
jgi:uncharacterized cupredoxin-like copper-binding protein